MHLPTWPSIPPKAKDLWDEWNLRGTILFSLLLQVVLIFVAPVRKCARKQITILLIWLAYLLADAVATYAIGLISNSQKNQNVKPEKHGQNPDLLAFWAPFLLVHLGGPDTITAFSLEDNQLWIRHLFSLFVQAGAVIYVFAQSLPNKKLWLPTGFMFLDGIIKYVERTRALYLASLDTFRDSMLKEPDPGPNYAKLMEEYDYKKRAQLPTTINMTPEPDKETKASDIEIKIGALNHLEVVYYAHHYFNIFKGLIVDLIFSFRERDQSHAFFKNRTAEDALKIIEVELNFIYGSLYTKAEVVHLVPIYNTRCWVGHIFRLMAFGSVLATLGTFYFQKHKQKLYTKYDVGITYTLLLGAIALDVVAFVTVIFSDRAFAHIKNPERLLGSPLAFFSNAFLGLKKPRWQTCNCQVKHQVFATPAAFRRWSGSIKEHNLIRYCLKSRSTHIHEFPSLLQTIFGRRLGSRGNQCSGSDDGSLCCNISKVTWSIKREVISKILWFAKETADGFLYVSSEPFTKELWEFIFEEIKKKSEFADTRDTAKRISSARGDWVLTDTESGGDRTKILKYVNEVSYDESILLWHIATDLCYYTEEKELQKRYCTETDEELKRRCGESLTHLQFSKILSDYMLYLLIFQPTMMSAVAGIGKIRFGDTCEEAKRFFERRSLDSDQDKEACDAILSVNTEVGPETVKGDRSKSVLFNASMLAKELKDLPAAEDDKWMIMSRVWVELLSYAASHCRASTHAAEVSKGGQLISFVWLLMSHFGLGEQFQINEGHARAKLIVGK